MNALNCWDEWGHPVTARDVCDPAELGDDTDLPEPYLDTDDPWSGWIVAQLIIAFADEAQSAEVPF